MSKHASKGKLVDLKINSKHHIKFPINTEYVWELDSGGKWKGGQIFIFNKYIL